jgi:hypothetical protein
VVLVAYINLWNHMNPLTHISQPASPPGLKTISVHFLLLSESDVALQQILWENYRVPTSPKNAERSREVSFTNFGCCKSKIKQDYRVNSNNMCIQETTWDVVICLYFPQHCLDPNTLPLLCLILGILQMSHLQRPQGSKVRWKHGSSFSSTNSQ